MSNPRILIPAVIMTLLMVSLAIAQNATGAINGTVTDPNEAVIPNATVTVTNRANGAARKFLSSTEGTFWFENLAPGEYEVKVEAQGFTSQIKIAVVRVGNTSTSNFSLSIGSTSQTVEVSGGGAPVLNTTDTGLGGIVTQRQIESLPLNGRSFLSVALLEPGVRVTYQATSGVLNQNDFFQVGIAGAPSYMTVISVDGARANDRITGGTSQNFSSESVQEFQIGTFGFDLSTGTVSAGAINIVSRSGGNDFHGSAFLYFRDHNMAAFPGLSRNCQGLASDSPLCRVPEARNRLDDPFFARKQYGGTLGGPIKKNKLFFFANYERSDQVGAQPITFNDQLLFGYNHIGKVPLDQHLIGTRVDYTISDKHTMFVRGNIDKNDSVAGTGMESTWIASSNYSYQTQFGLTSVFKPTLVNDFRFSYSYYRNRLFPPSQEICESLASDPIFCLGVGGTRINFFGGLSVGNDANTPQDRHPRTYQFTENISWTKGAHRFRFGGNWEHVYSRGSWFRNFAGTFSTFSPTTVLGTNLSIYNTLPASLKPGYTGPPPTFAELLQLPVTGQLTIGIGDPGQPVAYLFDELTTNNHIRFYLQDAWQLRPSFTLNYGLAWSFEDKQPYHFLDKPEYLRPTGLNLGKIPNDYNNFDPALGFAWSVNEKTVIRSSISLHHSSGNRNYLKLQDQIISGPAGSGLVSAGSSSEQNPFAQPGSLFRPGVPALPQNLNFAPNTPVDFRGQDMVNLLPSIRANLAAKLPYNGQDLSIRNIEVRKQVPAAGSEAIFDANHRTPYTIHLNAGVQRQILNDLSVSVDFVMRRGVKFGQNEFMFDDINRWNRFSGYQLIPTTGTANPLPFRNPVIPACSAAAVPPPTLDPNNPKAQCSLGPIFYAVPGILSRYTALQVKVDKRLSHGFLLTGAYALSKYTSFNGNLYASYTDYSENFGLSGASPKHTFSFSGIWDLPRYNGDQKLLRGVLNGWQVSTIMQMRSRDINSVTLGTFDLEGDGLFTFRLPGTGINSFGRGQDADDIRQLVDQYNSKFPAPKDTPLTQIGAGANRDATGTAFPFIILPDNFSSGDSFFTHDLRVTRTLSITEKFKLNLIAEGFNILNIANLTSYTGSLASAAFIRPTATTPGRPNPSNLFGQPTDRVSPIFGTGGPRAFQFAARLSF